MCERTAYFGPYVPRGGTTKDGRGDTWGRPLLGLRLFGTPHIIESHPDGANRVIAARDGARRRLL